MGDHIRDLQQSARDQRATNSILAQSGRAQVGRRAGTRTREQWQKTISLNVILAQGGGTGGHLRAMLTALEHGANKRYVAQAGFRGGHSLVTLSQ